MLLLRIISIVNLIEIAREWQLSKVLPFEVGRGSNVFYKIEEGFHIPKQGFTLEPQGIEPLFIDAFFLQFRENRRIFFTLLEFTL